MCIILFNKCVLSVYDFHFPALMTLCHMVSCLVFTTGLKALGVVQFEDFQPGVAAKVAPVSIAFVMNVVIGLAALRVVNVSMFT